MIERQLSCDVCDNEPAVGVAAVPGVPISVAYGQKCMAANAYPWWVLVANTAAMGGLDESAEWWKQMVYDTCAHLGKTLAEFEADVATAIEEERSGGGP